MALVLGQSHSLVPVRSWFASLWGSRHASKWWCCNLQCLGTVMPFDGVGRTPQSTVLPVFLVVVVMRARLIALLKCTCIPLPPPLCVCWCALFLFIFSSFLPVKFWFA